MTGESPTLTQVDFDGSVTFARWEAVADPTVRGYRIGVFLGNTRLYEGATEATEAHFTVGLDPGEDYTVRVRATGPSYSGSWGEPVPLVLTAPGTPALTATEHGTTAAWTPVDGISAYRLGLLDGQTEVAHVDAATTSSPLPTSPDPTKVYDARVRCLAGAGNISSGPWSEPATVIPTPRLTAVAFDGTSIAARWTPVESPDIKGYTVAVFSGAAAVYKGQTRDTQAKITVALEPGKAYVVQVRATGPSYTGPWSEVVPLVLTAPSGLNIATGIDGIAAAWASLPGAAAYRVALYEGETELSHVDVTAPSGTLPLPPEPDPGKTYTVKVQGLAGPDNISSGPWSPAVTAIFVAPELAAVACDGTAISADWNAVQAPGVAGYEVAVFTGETKVYSGKTTGTQARITVVLEPDKDYIIKVRATGAGSSGPWGEAIPLVLAAPTGLNIATGIDGIAAAWASLPGAAAYRVALYEGETELSHVDVTTPSGTLPLPPQPDPGKTYTVRVQGLAGPDNISSGPWSPAVTAIFAAPELAAVACDGTAIDASWSAVQAPGVAGYEIAVFTGDTKIYSGKTTDTKARITIALEPDKAYVVNVRATGTGSLGLWGGVVNVITVVPTISLVTYDGSNTLVTFQTPAAPGVTGAAGAVLVDGQEQYRGTAAQSPLTIPGALDANHVNTVKVQATGDRSTGPWSSAAFIFLDLPGGLLVTTDGTHITAAWQSLASVDGYEAALAENGVWGDPQATAQPSLTFATPLTSGVAYLVRVRARKGSSRGPWTAPVPGPFRRSGTIAYDYLGRMTTLTFTGVGTTTYEYDDLGNVTKVTVTGPEPDEDQQRDKAG